MSEKVLTGYLLNEKTSLTLEEFTRVCQAETTWVVELVDEAVLQPEGSERENWRFRSASLRRALTVRRLQRDLGVNIAGAALAVELIEELESLRARINALEENSP